MLAISALHAIRDAIASTAGYQLSPRLDAPATPESVLRSLEEIAVQRGATTTREKTPEVIAGE